MNNSPFLSVVVGMVPVCCSDLLPRGNHPPFTTRVSRLGAVTPPARPVRWRPGKARIPDSTRAPDRVPRPRYPVAPPAPAGSTEPATPKGRMMTFAKRVRSAAVVVLLAGSSLGLTGLAASASATSPVASSAYRQANLVSDIPGLARHTDPNLRNSWGTSTGPGLPIWVADNHAG